MTFFASLTTLFSFATPAFAFNIGNPPPPVFSGRSLSGGAPSSGFTVTPPHSDSLAPTGGPVLANVGGLTCHGKSFPLSYETVQSNGGTIHIGVMNPAAFAKAHPNVYKFLLQQSPSGGIDHFRSGSSYCNIHFTIDSSIVPPTKVEIKGMKVTTLQAWNINDQPVPLSPNIVTTTGKPTRLQVCDPYSGYIQPNEVVGANNTNVVASESSPAQGYYTFLLSHPTQGYNLLFDCAGKYQIAFEYIKVNEGDMISAQPQQIIHNVTAKQTLKLSTIPRPKKQSTTTYWQSPSQAGNLFLSK